MKKLVLYGLGAIIVLAVIGSLAGGNKDNGVSAGGSGTANATDGPVQAKIGQPVTIDGIEVTIKKAETSQGGEFLRPAAGSIWIGYDISLKALDDSRFVSSSDWTALSDGNKQGQWTITTEDNWKPLLSLSDLRAGATVEGWVAFEVPKPDSYVRLIYDPSFFSDEAKLTFDAQVK